MHYANMPNIIAYVIYRNFFSDSCENDNFQMMKCLLFLIFAQNIDCGHTLIELHQSLSVSNEYPQSIFKSKQYLKKKCIPL